MEMDLVGRVDVLNGFEAPFDIINKSGTKKNMSRRGEAAEADGQHGGFLFTG